MKTDSTKKTVVLEYLFELADKASHYDRLSNAEGIVPTTADKYIKIRDYICPLPQADQAKSNEWQLITILRKLQESGLPMPNKIKDEVELGSKQLVFYWDNYTFCADSLVILDNQMRGYEEYNILNDSFDEAITKLKELLSKEGGDER